MESVFDKMASLVQRWCPFQDGFFDAKMASLSSWCICQYGFFDAMIAALPRWHLCQDGVFVKMSFLSSLSRWSLSFRRWLPCCQNSVLAKMSFLSRLHLLRDFILAMMGTCLKCCSCQDGACVQFLSRWRTLQKWWCVCIPPKSVFSG